MQCCGYVISNPNDENIVRTFHEKGFQKKNKSRRISDNSFNSQINIKDIIL